MIVLSIAQFGEWSRSGPRLRSLLLTTKWSSPSLPQFHPAADILTKRRDVILECQQYLDSTFSRSSDMAAKTLEARFEHLTVTDENDVVGNGAALLKSKVKALLNYCT